MTTEKETKAKKDEEKFQRIFEMDEARKVRVKAARAKRELNH